jgi:hypothetical protein
MTWSRWLSLGGLQGAHPLTDPPAPACQPPPATARLSLSNGSDQCMWGEQAAGSTTMQASRRTRVTTTLALSMAFKVPIPSHRSSLPQLRARLRAASRKLPTCSPQTARLLVPSFLNPAPTHCAPCCVIIPPAQRKTSLLARAPPHLSLHQPSRPDQIDDFRPCVKNSFKSPKAREWDLYAQFVFVSTSNTRCCPKEMAQRNRRFGPTVRVGGRNLLFSRVRSTSPPSSRGRCSCGGGGNITYLH